MLYSIFTTLQAGREYSKKWPAQAELNSLFVENKVILLTAITWRYLPLSALFCAVLQLSYLGLSYLPQSVAMVLFLISIPVQGWYWLGVRALTPLPPAIAHWCHQIRQKMQQHGIATAPVQGPERYKDLALLLQQAYQQLDRSFVKQWL